ncbi:copper resistance CopC family protein [Actinokineospora sp. NBRC 105648]|uniref:copper resistance CopC family protein n=1 Tax=Actinokineospora sp. NBRC 105648 TaxID=3032206 RepID=UPI0024A32FC0|nr:copper resistance CopC family protein [Actinokineospora sp. NBRC 105648]GLZ41291.1 copper resistance protein C [Actinokineospora sp. NBRC 105648]
MRTLGRAVGALVVALFAVVGLAGPALAHNQLVSSNPADKASLETGPGTIELTFDQPVQAGENLNTLVVVGPAGKDQWQAGKAAVRGNVVSAPLRPLGPAGEYRVGYRILSADGHPVTGEIKFTLTKAGNGTPAPAEEVAQDTGTPAASTPDDGGVPVWVWIGGAVLLLGAGIVLAMRLGGSTP